MSEPLRRGFIGLPIQRSIFGDLDRIGELLGLADVLPGGRFEARLDDRGDLYLDPAQVRALSEAIVERCSVRLVARAGAILRHACTGLLDATRALVDRPPASSDEAEAALTVLEARLRALSPFPLMTKFVPEALRQCLERAGDRDPPPFPDPSPGRRVGMALLALADRCLAAGYEPDRLAAAWPEVKPEVVDAVARFCRQQTGFGPAAWEWPGYETPSVVFDAMAGALAGSDRSRVAPLPDPADLDPGPRHISLQGPQGSAAATVRTVLALWLEYLDLEIWHLRRAFYLAVVPVLRVLAGKHDVAGEDLLFVPMEELARGVFDRGAAADRRRRYEADAEYLGRGRIQPERLAAIMVPSSERTGVER